MAVWPLIATGRAGISDRRGFRVYAARDAPPVNRERPVAGWSVSRCRRKLTSPASGLFSRSDDVNGRNTPDHHGIASIWHGRISRVSRTASRRAPIAATRRLPRPSGRLSVKKHQPPATRLTAIVRHRFRSAQWWAEAHPTPSPYSTALSSRLTVQRYEPSGKSTNLREHGQPR